MTIAETRRLWVPAAKRIPSGHRDRARRARLFGSRTRHSDYGIDRCTSRNSASDHRASEPTDNELLLRNFGNLTKFDVSRDLRPSGNALVVGKLVLVVALWIIEK